MESDQQEKEEKEEGKQQQNNEKSKEEEEKKAGDGFGGNLDINVNTQRLKKNLDGANDRTISGDARTQHYLYSLLRGNDVNLQEILRQAIDDHFGQNRRYPDVNYDTLTWFVTDWLGLIDVPPSELRNLMHMVRFLRENDVDDEFGGNEFGRNVDADIQTVIENLDGVTDVREVDCQLYLDQVRRDIDMDAQMMLLRAIGDYYHRNGRFPYFDKDTLQGFLSIELQLDDVSPEVFFNERIKKLHFTHRRLRTIVNAIGASCLQGLEVEMVRLGDKVHWGIESNDLPSNSQVGNGFGGNLDGANQDARDDLDEDFRDDPNFSIDVEELLRKWEQEESRREM